MRKILAVGFILVLAVASATATATAAPERVGEVRAACEINIRANPLQPGWSLDQALDGCVCLAERSANDDALQSEIVQSASKSAAELEAQMSPALLALTQTCWPEPRN